MACVAVSIATYMELQQPMNLDDRWSSQDSHRPL